MNASFSTTCADRLILFENTATDTIGKPSLTSGGQYTGCGNAGNSFALSGQIRSTSTYDSYGNARTTTDPDANAGNTAHKGCTVGSSTYTTCVTYDFDV